MLLDQVERLLGIEFGHHHDGPAEDGREQREGARGGMIEGARHQMHLALVDHPERLHERERELRVGGGAERALGLSGGPAGVDHGAAEALGRVDRRRLGAAFVEELGEARRPLAALGAERDPEAHPGGVPADLVRHRHEGSADECRHGVGVLQDVAHLFGHQPMVHRNRHGIGRAGGGRGQEVFERVRRVDDHVLAAADAPLDERAGEAISTLQQLSPGQPTIALDLRDRVGLRLRVNRDVVQPDPCLGSPRTAGPQPRDVLRLANPHFG